MYYVAIRGRATPSGGSRRRYRGHDDSCAGPEGAACVGRLPPSAALDNLRRFAISATTSLRRVWRGRLDVSIAEAKCLSDLRINIVGSAKKCHGTPLNVR